MQGGLLRYASAELRADEEVVTTALNQDPGAWQFVSEHMRLQLEYDPEHEEQLLLTDG
eukprot:NODE_27235_length_520_cov_3.969466.p4 GENE.NODE_27235_length_520_cov_3.969466~~NODE_27235_length_520_cov_3.969466.p4  ORF type:complete len:58 (+),score=20.05 NODE_27235_length_520_cov_3.969466:178-351(+)